MSIDVHPQDKKVADPNFPDIVLNLIQSDFATLVYDRPGHKSAATPLTIIVHPAQQQTDRKSNLDKSHQLFPPRPWPKLLRSRRADANASKGVWKMGAATFLTRGCQLILILTTLA